MMKETEPFIKAYHDFRKSVDFSKCGIMPELDNLIWCMLMGVPAVPSDDGASADAPMTAIDQRVAILKAVFAEVNRDQPDNFLDQGLLRYDQAGQIAKNMLKEVGRSSDSA